MNWLEKILPKSKHISLRRHNIPEGVWSKCTACQQFLYKTDLEKNLEVCPKCAAHMPISARKRLTSFLDEKFVVEHGADLLPQDILKFKDNKKYKERINSAQKKTGEKEALLVMEGTVKMLPVVVCAFNFDFIGGSLSSAVGDRFVKACEVALNKNIPLVCFSASGGARMQEALMSLMQMWRVSAMLAKLSERHIPFISILTEPTYGGVTASLAMLGDINIAEPNARIGFAGTRVIEQTVRETLPDGFQRSEMLLEKGALDMIVDRRQIRSTVAQVLSKFRPDLPYESEHVCISSIEPTQTESASKVMEPS